MFKTLLNYYKTCNSKIVGLAEEAFISLLHTQLYFIQYTIHKWGQLYFYFYPLYLFYPYPKQFLYLS